MNKPTNIAIINPANHPFYGSGYREFRRSMTLTDAYSIGFVFFIAIIDNTDMGGFYPCMDTFSESLAKLIEYERMKMQDLKGTNCVLCRLLPKVSDKVK